MRDDSHDTLRIRAVDTRTSIRACGRSALGLFLLAMTAVWADASAPKRVLLVHSFGSTAPPFTTHSTAFENTLIREMGEPIDLDQVSLDMARYAQPDMEEAFVEFLGNRLKKWQPDLVVPIGSPAARFVARNRQVLFPNTPVLYAGLDQRLLPADALATNAAFVGIVYHIDAFGNEMLQLKPDTTNLVVVIGASVLEQHWTERFRQGFAPFTNRVGLTFLNTMSFDQMLDHVSTLPPRSFIFLGLLVQDATGVMINQDHALQRLHAVARAPINGIFQNQLGLGIVGGNLYPAEDVGEESARVAIRILRGEPVSSFPPRVVPPLPPQYDWRELRRWNIPENRLPPGSIISFRQPTFWALYGWRIFAIFLVTVVEAFLIAYLAISLLRRRRAEQLLRESEERMNLAADSARAGLWSVDLATRHVWSTPRWRELFEFRDNEELTFEKVLQRIHPDDRENVRQTVLRATESGGDMRVEFRIALPNGNVRWISARGHANGKHPEKPSRFSGAAVDITEQRKTESETQLLHQELAHVSRVATIGELTASIAHELNQPLTAILSNAQEGMRMTTAANPNLAELREILSDIAADDRRASEVIRRLRSLLKKGEAERQPLSLNSLVNDVMPVVRSDAELRRVAITLDLASTLPLVLADRVQLQQVLLNLMVNAFDAMGHVTHRPRNIILRTRALGETQVHLDVVDNGTGIDPTKLNAIFEPFFTTKKHGMGMGLPVSRSIVEAHRGRLWAENNPVHGATFHMILPSIRDAEMQARV